MTYDSVKLFISLVLTMALIATTLTAQQPAGGDPELARKIARFCADHFDGRRLEANTEGPAGAR